MLLSGFPLLAHVVRNKMSLFPLPVCLFRCFFDSCMHSEYDSFPTPPKSLSTTLHGQVQGLQLGTLRSIRTTLAQYSGLLGIPLNAIGMPSPLLPIKLEVWQHFRRVLSYLEVEWWQLDFFFVWLKRSITHPSGSFRMRIFTDIVLSYLFLLLCVHSPTCVEEAFAVLDLSSVQSTISLYYMWFLLLLLYSLHSWMYRKVHICMTKANKNVDNKPLFLVLQAWRGSSFLPFLSLYCTALSNIP